MKLVIDRSKWLRGDANGRLIRTSDGKMCCLGFFGLACGVPPELMNDVGEPQEAVPDYPQRAPWPDWAVELDEERSEYDGSPEWRARNMREVEYLIEANDDSRTTDAEREAIIANVFARNGVEVEFVG